MEARRIKERLRSSGSKKINILFSDTQPSKNTDGASILLFFNIAGKV